MDYETAQGTGNASGLAAGALFTLTNYPRTDQNREYLIVAAKYKLQFHWDRYGTSDEKSSCWVRVSKGKELIREHRESAYKLPRKHSLTEVRPL